MTIPKDPSAPDNNKQISDQPTLGDTINELEDLISDNGTLQETTDNDENRIPVLDDVVTPEDTCPQDIMENFQQYTENDHVTLDNITQRRLAELVDTIDGKLTDELNALVEILKDTIKDSIIDELKTQLKTTETKTSHPDHDSDNR